MARSGAFISFAVLLAIFEIGSCTMCYQCNSQSQADCADPFNKEKIRLVDCNNEADVVVGYNNQYLRPLVPNILVNVAGAAKYCHKIVTNTNTVLRVCLEDNPSVLNTTCNLIARIPNIKHCSVCDKDNCNGAGSITASFSLALAALFTSYLFLKQ